MFKRIFTLLTAAFCLLSAPVTETSQTDTFTPAETSSLNTDIAQKAAIFLDLHGVLVTWNYARVFKVFWNIENKMKTLSQLIKIHVLKSNPTIQAKLAALKKDNVKVKEAYLDAYKEEAPELHKAGTQLFVDIFQPDPAMYNPETGTGHLYDLKKEGYNLYVLSNSGPYFYELLKNKYPNYFKDLGLEQNTINNNGEFHSKTAPETYTYAAQSIGKNPKDCIFVDDKKKNLDAASAAGFRTIRYASPEQSHNDIRARISEMNSQH